MCFLVNLISWSYICLTVMSVIEAVTKLGIKLLKRIVVLVVVELLQTICRFKTFFFELHWHESNTCGLLLLCTYEV